MRHTFFFQIICLLSFSASGQRMDLEVMAPNTLQRNKVHKIYRYDLSDSSKFAKEHPNGAYVVLDEDGRLIESNGYSQRTDEDGGILFEERKTYYLYDYASGEQIGMVSMKPDSGEPVQMIRLESRNPETKKIRYAELGTGSGGAYISFDEGVEKPLDTLRIDAFHTRVFLSKDSLTFEDTYLNRNSLLIDSTVFSFETYPIQKGVGPKDDSRSRIRSTYGVKNGLNLKVKDEYFNEPNPRPVHVKEFFYSENGLLQSTRKSSAGKETELIKYVYTYRE